MINWAYDSVLRVNDICEYLEWQLIAVSEGLDWYFDCNWQQKAIRELRDSSSDITESLDRKSKEVTVQTGRMLRGGRFDDFEWSEEEVQRKRRRVGR